MRPARLSAYSGVIAMAIVMGGTAGAAEPGLEWTQIPDDEAKIVFYAPGLQGGLKRFFRTRDPGRFHTQEVGKWIGPSGRYPYAQIVLIRLGPRFHFNRRADLKNEIRSMLGERKAKFSHAGSDRNVLGKIDYVRYYVDTDSCVGFSQYFGQNYDHDGPWSEGNSMLYGSYCVGADKALSVELLAAVLKGVGVVGEKVPDPPAFALRSPTGPATTEIVDCRLPSRLMSSRHTGDFTRRARVIATTRERCISEGGKVLLAEEAKGAE